MEKKRSKGVTIFGWFSIISSFPFFSYLQTLISNEQLLKSIEHIKTSAGLNYTPFSYTVVCLFSVVSSILCFAIGVLFLKQKEIGRKIAFYLLTIQIPWFVILGVYHILNDSKLLVLVPTYIFGICLNVALIYFITRPKVKEQFR